MLKQKELSAALIHNKIKHDKKQKYKSSVFSSALNIDESSEVLDWFSKAIRCCRWDVSILELLGQCLTNTCSTS